MGTIVLYPAPSMGHLISMVELGKVIRTHHPEFAITVLLVNLPFKTGSTATYINRVSTATPSISFHYLPSLPFDSDSCFSMEDIIFKLCRLINPHVHQALESISSTTVISAFIIDFFCTPALSVGTNLNIPTYYFFTSAAHSLALLLYLPTLHLSTPNSFKDLDELLHVPGLPPIPPSDMPVPYLDRTSTEYTFFLDVAMQFRKSSGILVNTFESLEQNFLKLLSDGIYVPVGSTPPVFSVGPLIASGDRQGGGATVHECLKWLDLQPRQSVVFLCFGSLGLFSAEQLKEIAIGLESSEQRFLWVVRSPPPEDKRNRFQPPPAPDLDLLLPHGFLERTKVKGVVVGSWAPQVDVLNHDSVGGFVTHCGWNSVLEAICAGVPMVAWPLYAEQKMNRLFLVEEMKLALPLDETEGGLVKASEIEKRVRELMDLDKGNLFRERAQTIKEEAKQAMTANGGSSCVTLAKLTESWKLD